MHEKGFMKIYFVKYFCLACCIFLTKSAFASSGGEHGALPPDISTLFLPFVNFVIYVGFLVFCYFKYVKKLIADRSVKIEEQIENCAKELANAQSKYAKTKERIIGIYKERERIIKDLEQEGHILAGAIVKAAEKAASELKTETQHRIDSELQKAKGEIRAKIVHLASNLAKEKLGLGLSSDDDYRLRKEAILSI